MRLLSRVIAALLALAVLAVAGGYAWLWTADRYRADGELALVALEAPVRIVRDGQGVPYIHAESLDDALRAQGLVAAQDHLFDIEVSRYLAQGRLAELIGEAGLKSDVTVRVVGIPRHARRQATLLAGRERRWRELYLEGLNAYIRDHRDEHPVGLRLLGIEAQPWTLEDSLALGWFVNWSSSANLSAELVSQALVDAVGPARAAEIGQLSVNPDDESEQSGRPLAAPAAVARLPGLEPGRWGEAAEAAWQLGSNNWVVAGRRSTGGAPVVVNDPHIDARTLPGRWHPVGLITPTLRAVGAAGPGLPGLAVARTTHLAYGITNSYGDVADLYVEREDPVRPGHYLEGDRSLPFEVIEETLRVRERGSATGFREVPLRIRLTRRGPVISDHGMSTPAGALLSLRWSAPETMRPDDASGTGVLAATSVAEARAEIARVNAPYNYVVADTLGNIAHFTAGRVPLRLRGDGSTPLPVGDGTDSWAGMIPPEALPATVNPPGGWTGTANHRTVPAGYPYAYSTYFAASWRYRRMQELLGGDAVFAPGDHWAFMRDVANPLAARIAPMMAEALAGEPDLAPLAAVLRDWDHRDDPDAVAPTVFQATWREFARLAFEDELGAATTARMLESWYFWHERLARLCEDAGSAWFDDVATPAREDRDALFRRAARAAAAELAARLGDDPAGWRWGRVHTITFASPIVPGRFAAALLGGGTRPMEGSGETLNRAIYRYEKPYETVTIASLRFVADLADPDKVMAVLPGGASSRQFGPHLDDQLDAWASGEPRYWWFSDAAIAREGRHVLRLVPGGAGRAAGSPATQDERGSPSTP